MTSTLRKVRLTPILVACVALASPVALARGGRGGRGTAAPPSRRQIERLVRQKASRLGTEISSVAERVVPLARGRDRRGRYTLAAARGDSRGTRTIKVYDDHSTGAFSRELAYTRGAGADGRRLPSAVDLAILAFGNMRDPATGRRRSAFQTYLGSTRPEIDFETLTPEGIVVKTQHTMSDAPDHAFHTFVVPIVDHGVLGRPVPIDVR